MYNFKYMYILCGVFILSVILTLTCFHKEIKTLPPVYTEKHTETRVGKADPTNIYESEWITVKPGLGGVSILKGVRVTILVDKECETQDINGYIEIRNK